ncbi:MAG: hypothetical protein ACPK85_12060 [Methanosarcina sp.]
MTVLSIITCKMFEDELAYILSSDRELEQLIVVEGKDSFGLLRKLKSNNCLPRTAPLDRVPFLLGDRHSFPFMKLAKPFLKLPFFRKTHEDMKLRAAHRVTVVVNLLRRGLHDDLEILKSEVYENIEEMASSQTESFSFTANEEKPLRAWKRTFQG